MPSGGSRIGSEEAFYLYASGPDLTSIMPCKYGKPSGTFSKYVTTDGLKCDTVRELMMKNKDVDTAALIECLAVVYAPSSPRVYTIYEPVIRLKGQAKTMVSQRPFSSREGPVCGAGDTRPQDHAACRTTGPAERPTQDRRKPGPSCSSLHG
ncbi:lysosomal-trafficking regulator-like [Salvelinus sp. IW2-2015]|uniref:lysosomal-trafficking regulator-like n=1 Tax=Salvelinus sp. IW2-2015 TaxID=2691554 RepID=UPI000CEACCB2|nr:lysosomal-trafficking regulator-like [Salvelinus alpinus]